MKKLLFILLIISASAEAQTLYKTVNGVKVEFSQADYTQYRIDSVNNRVNLFNDSVATAKKTALYNSIKTTAQSAVGVSVGSLTATQVRALFAITLFKEGALDSLLKVKPLGQWVK